ncbi:MAG: AzlD domain-containing protein [Hyphomicrobiaceae bacterium]|nr:AzlD domain-containing protein [Hyphomicrobiaceae bacterium]
MTIPTLADGYGGYLTLALIALIAHEPWRWLGLAIGKNISEDSAAFLWVRFVATALVAGLVMRLILFPAGALQTITLPLRLAALAVGVIAFFLLGRSLGLGIAAGAATVLAVRLAGFGG